MAHHRHRESYPPPLFVAELDTAPVHGTVAAPQGGLAFEMPGESAPARRDEPERRPVTAAEVSETTQANPWPFYLDQEVKTQGGQGGDGSNEDGGHKEQANPWPYHGPVLEDDAPSATIYPVARRKTDEGEEGSLAGKVEGLKLDSDESLQNGLGKSGQQVVNTEGEGVETHTAPVRVSQNSISTTSPPPSIRPYCPPPGREDIVAGGLNSPSTGAPPKSPPTQGPQSPGVPYRPYRPPSISSPSGTTIAQSPNATGAGGQHVYMPFNPDSQPTSPSIQGHAVPNASEENKTTADGESSVIKPYSPPHPPKVTPAVTGTPTNVVSPQSPPPPANWGHVQANVAQPSLILPGMTAVSPMPPYHSPSPQIPPSPASSYNTLQPTYAPSPSLSPQPHQTRPHVQHANTDPTQPNYTPLSPPPYPYPGPAYRPDSQPPPTQYPPYSPPPPPSPYPPQPIYASPPLPSGKPPPPLPPRRPVQYGGFVGGPSNTGNFPPPPKTHYNPMPPPYPPRPGGGMSSTSLFSSGSAKKWFDKTSQVLENTLESVLQGPQGPSHRPAYAQGPPPPQGAYPNGPQTRGMPPPGYGYAPGQWGPGPGQPPPGWRP